MIFLKTTNFVFNLLLKVISISFFWWVIFYAVKCLTTDSPYFQPLPYGSSLEQTLKQSEGLFFDASSENTTHLLGLLSPR